MSWRSGIQGYAVFWERAGIDYSEMQLTEERAEGLFFAAILSGADVVEAFTHDYDLWSTDHWHKIFYRHPPRRSRK